MLDAQVSTTTTTNNDDSMETKFRRRHLSKHDKDTSGAFCPVCLWAFPSTMRRHTPVTSLRTRRRPRGGSYSSPHTTRTSRRVVSCRVATAGAASRIALAPQRRVPSHLCPSFVSARGIARAESGERRDGIISLPAPLERALTSWHSPPSAVRGARSQPCRSS